MEWIDSLFTIHSAVQTLVVLALIISVGMALGKLRIRGISLGVAFVFFMGIVAGSLHFTADEQMVSFAETLRPLYLRLRPGSARRTQLHRYDAPRRCFAQRLEHGRDTARHGDGTVAVLRAAHKHPRHGGHTLRSDDEHTSTRCSAAGTCHTAHLEQRCGR